MSPVFPVLLRCHTGMILSLSRNSGVAGDASQRLASVRRIRHCAWRSVMQGVKVEADTRRMQMSADKSLITPDTRRRGLYSAITGPVGAVFILLLGCVEKGG